MVGNVRDGGSELEGQLRAFSVLLGNLVDVVEDRGDEFVDVILAHIVPHQDDCCDCDRADIFRETVRACGDREFCVVG